MHFFLMYTTKVGSFTQDDLYSENIGHKLCFQNKNDVLAFLQQTFLQMILINLRIHHLNHITAADGINIQNMLFFRKHYRWHISILQF